MRDVDVLVIGSGAAGLCAALTAHEKGACAILVAEAEDVVGGSSRLSGGVVMGSGTRLQKAAGIDDHPDDLMHDYMQLNQWDVHHGAVATFTRRCGETVDWLADLGVPFFDRLIFGGDERLPRSHCVDGGGQVVINVLHSRCRNLGIDVALRRRVDRLLVEGGGSSAPRWARTGSPQASSSQRPAGSGPTPSSWPRTSPAPGTKATPGTSGPTVPAATRSRCRAGRRAGRRARAGPAHAHPGVRSA
jgi:succinate dehydrogenase/fumarate reductase flavoprotein subunit